jgi:DNA-binding transcriptional MerR regulator
MSTPLASTLKPLPPIPAKRYFTIGEVSDLCGVKPHVLRYWEQEFTQLRPIKRRGNRRYYQHHEVLLVRRIRELLYEQGFTISGARNRLDESGRRRGGRGSRVIDPAELAEMPEQTAAAAAHRTADPAGATTVPDVNAEALRSELLHIRALLAGPPG